MAQGLQGPKIHVCWPPCSSLKWFTYRPPPHTTPTHLVDLAKAASAKALQAQHQRVGSNLKPRAATWSVQGVQGARSGQLGGRGQLNVSITDELRLRPHNQTRQECIWPVAAVLR
jgi:hypothetical protein